MESIVDIVRMEILTKASKREKDKWKYLILLAIIGNYRYYLEQFRKYICMVLFRIGMLKKYITPAPKKDKPAKSIVKLKFSKNDTNNRIFKELLKKHGSSFDTVQLKDPHQWHVVQPKTITLADDIFFRLDFHEAQPPPPKPQHKSEENWASESENPETKKERERLLSQEFELHDSRGQVFSYDKTLQELLDFLHENYVPPEPKPVVSVQMPKRVALFNMQVGRVTKFNMKTDELVGEYLKFPVSKNLDNIFLEPDIRERLMSQIERFSDPVWYAERGLPRTLGILLYGQPGCGKTSFIKAVCSHMKRKVLIVDFKLVRTVSQLRKIFSGTIRDTNREDYQYDFAKDGTVYVFEDFDCMSEVFMDRKAKSERDAETQSTKKQKQLQPSLLEEMLMYKRMELLASREKEKEKRRSRKAKKKDADADTKETDKKAIQNDLDSSSEHSDEEEEIDLFANNSCGATEKWGLNRRNDEKVTLADFLELLDGIIEMDGRIIIMTTNQREKMDSALVRPGRIDLDLELKPPSRLLIAHIFNHMYKHLDIDMLKDLYFKYYDFLPESVVSTARVINCFMLTDPEHGMQMLVKCHKEVNDAQVVEIGAGQPDHFQHSWTANSIWENVVCTDKRHAAKEENSSVDIYPAVRGKVIVSNQSGNRFEESFLNVDSPCNYSYHDSRCGENVSLSFTFKEKEVNVTDYSIHLGNACYKRFFNWNLEGSMDGISWEILSAHKDDYTLTKMECNLAKFTVPRNTQYYKALRIISTGPPYLNDGRDNQRKIESPAARFFEFKTIQFFGSVRDVA